MNGIYHAYDIYDIYHILNNNEYKHFIKTSYSLFPICIFHIVVQITDTRFGFILSPDDFQWALEKIAWELTNSSGGVIDIIRKYLDEVGEMAFFFKTMAQRIGLSINESTIKAAFTRPKSC